MNPKIKKILLLIVAIFITVYVGVNIYVDSLLNRMDKDEPSNDDVEIYVEEPKKEVDKVVNFLLVGADNLDSSGREESWLLERSDVMKIISLDYTSKTIKITSLDRDVVEYFPSKGYEDFYRFNWAFSFDGPKLCMATINYNLDLDVSRYVSMSFKGFKSIIDYIGGVDVKLSEQEVKALNKSSNFPNKITDGINHLNGAQALDYSRLRSIDDDVMRMARQTIVIKAVVNKLKDSSYLELLDIITNTLPYVNTNLTNDEIKKYLLDVIDFDLQSIDTINYPEDIYNTYWNNTTSMGGYVLNDYIYEASRIHGFIYNDYDYEPSNNIKKVNEEVHKKFEK